MTVKFTSVAANLEKEVKGDWIDYPDWPGVALNVSSLHKPSFMVARDLLLLKLSRNYKRRSVPPEVMAEETAKLYCAHILHGWRGFDVEYTPDVALKALSDPAYRKLREAVEWCAGFVAERDVEFIEDSAKN